MSSCQSVEIHSIEKFELSTSTVSLTQYLLPDEGFIDMFKYTDGNYHYYDNCKLANALELVLMELSYDAETYSKAKNYCLESMYLSDENVKEYNGYIFLENLELPQHLNRLENQKNVKFPYTFAMFSYNDSKQTLIFIGFYCGTGLHNEVDRDATDWGAFLDKYYSEYYDFDK